MKNDFIVLLVGKSGVGKTTIANELKNLYHWNSVQSYTDRPKRYDGEEGHTFLSKEEFDKILWTDMVAYTNFDGHRYCATKKQVDESQIYIIDPAGIKFFKNHYKGEKKIIVAYVTTSFFTGIMRIFERGDGVKKAMKRVFHDIFKFRGMKSHCDICIYNEGIKPTVAAEQIYIDTAMMLKRDRKKD